MNIVMFYLIILYWMLLVSFVVLNHLKRADKVRAKMTTLPYLIGVMSPLETSMLYIVSEA